MKFNVHEWIGTWDNFESYIYSESEPMKICWAEAEEAVKAIPSPMFKNGAKGFWQTAYSTVTEKIPFVWAAGKSPKRKTGYTLSGWTKPEILSAKRITRYRIFFRRGWKAKKTSFSKPQMHRTDSRSAVCWQWNRCRSVLRSETEVC
ncbi:MAG: hypothetical protein E7579_11920 [Ruminococcaceae bacterium]|nr:hypothetical protein [Oscillospiraceae bacterium]